MGHWLTHLYLFVRVLYNIGLIDDVHQGTQLRNAPKHPVDAQTQFPFAVANIAVHQQIGLTEITVRAVRVPGIVPQEGSHRYACAFLVLKIERCLQGKPASIRTLVGIRGALGIQPGLCQEAPGDINLVSEPGRVRHGREQRNKHPQQHG